jgi:hypothetical protein
MTGHEKATSLELAGSWKLLSHNRNIMALFTYKNDQMNFLNR